MSRFLYVSGAESLGVNALQVADSSTIGRDNMPFDTLKTTLFTPITPLTV